jgi:hypothetical protein
VVWHAATAMETFVVRIWQPADADTDIDEVGLRGTVECVRSASSRPFSGRDELVRIIEAELAAGPS